MSVLRSCYHRDNETIADQRAASCKLAHSSCWVDPVFNQEQLGRTHTYQTNNEYPDSRPSKRQRRSIMSPEPTTCATKWACRYWQKPCPHYSAHAQGHRQRRHARRSPGRSAIRDL